MDSGTKIDISVVSLTWNSEKYINDFLSTLLVELENIKLLYEVFIIDNGSQDSTPDKLKNFSDKIKIIKLHKNFGTTYSRNLALKKAKGKYLLIIDSDTIVLKNSIKELLNAFKIIKSKNIGIISPKLLFPDKTNQLSTFRFPTLISKISRIFNNTYLRYKFDIIPASLKNKACLVEYSISACWIFKKALLNKIGFLDENIFYAPEDADFCKRVQLAGFEVWYYPKSQILHHCQRFSKKNIFSKLFFLHIFGLFYFWKKYKKK